MQTTSVSSSIETGGSPRSATISAHVKNRTWASPGVERHEALAFLDREREVDVAHRLHLDLGRLDHGDAAALRVDDELTLTDRADRFARPDALLMKARRGRLLAREDRRDELVAERPREPELGDRKLSRARHAEPRPLPAIAW